MSAPATTTTAPVLSFPRATFAKLSPSPFLLAHLKPSAPNTLAIRPNGRAPSEHRTPTINTSSLTHSSGSAVVRVGDTAVVCGVRGELLLVSDIPHPRRDNTDLSDTEISDMGLLVPNLELSTGCSPAHLPSNAPGTLAQSLSQRVLSLLETSDLVDLQDLEILYRPPVTDPDSPDETPGTVVKAYWALYIDILFISLDGNPFDAAWLAVVAALRDTRLPQAWWDADREMILCSDSVRESRRLSIRCTPIASTFAIYTPGTVQQRRSSQESWMLADPDGFEEELCDETVTVVLECSKGNTSGILKIEKNGGGVVGRALMRRIFSETKRKWHDWSRALEVTDAV
ncbi:ribosomal protein S5 domain 2-type protein [Cryomyces antarcticus]